MVCGLICAMGLIMCIRTEEFTGTTIKLSYSYNSIWKLKMEDLPYCKNLYDSIKLGTAKLMRKSYDDWEKMN